MTAHRAPALRRLVLSLLTIGLACAGWALTDTLAASGSSYAAPTPQAPCGPGAKPETDIQGRVPQKDFDDGRAAEGYRCNTRQVSHQGSTGGFKVWRYRDSQGHVCAYYDSTLLFPKDVLFNAAKGLGVIVLDMSDPAHPRQTATLTSPAMLSPHESLLLNKKRGLLGGVLGNPGTTVGILDLYRVRDDCRHPQLLSSTDTALLGHESGWAPDGRTFYASSTGGNTFAAIDTTHPRSPKTIFVQYGVNYHGMRVSHDGRTLYVADIGNPTGAQISGGGLRILDVSQIQDRRANPQVKVVSDLTWPEESIPQVPEPFVRGGRHYLLEVDEYANYSLTGALSPGDEPVGAARIIDIQDPRHPVVVSNLRLQVHQPDARNGDERNDPGASIPVQGYAGHYCSVPTRKDPRIVACSMIISGLRVFDISSLRHPQEVGYFNKPLVGTKPDNPTAMSSFAMSEPAWDLKRHSIWYTDGNTGFYDVKLTNGIGKLLD